MNKSINYPIFTLNNESVILKPGTQFSKNELVSRLHDMDIDASGVKSKGDLINLYESSLSNFQNKLKIFNRLKKDTENFKSIIGTSQRQSIPSSNMSNFSMSNNPQNKVINVNYDMDKPFNQNNSGKKEINLIRQSNKSNARGENYNNQKQNNETAKFGYSDNQMNNYENNMYPRNFPNNGQSNNPNILKNNRYSNDTYQSNQNNTYSTNSMQNNLNTKFDESYNPYSSNNSKRSNQNMNINSQMNYPSQNNSKINYQNNITDMRNSNRGYSNSQYHNQIQNNSNRGYNPQNQEEINSKLNSKNNTPFSFKGDSYNENNPKIFTNIQNTTPISPENAKFFQNNNYNQINQNRNEQGMSIEDQRNPKLSTVEDAITDNRQQYQRESDEESNFSMFSTFKNFKNSPLYKNRKTICFNILLSLLVISLAIGVLCLIRHFSDSITNFFTEFFNTLTDPERLFGAIGGFLNTLFLGPLRYYYITIPLISMIVIMIYYGRKYFIEKRCREIMKKMEQFLLNNQNNPNNFLLEDQIFNMFAQEYGISLKKFKAKYLPVMKKLRINKNSRLKLYPQEFNGKQVVSWGLR